MDSTYPDPEQLRELRQIIRRAYDHAPAMRAKLDRAGLTPDRLRTWADYEKVPLTTKEEHRLLQQERPPHGGVLAVPLSGLKRISLHPGPIYDWITQKTFNSALEFARSAGFSDRDIVAVTFDYHLMGAGSVFDQALGRLGAATVPMGPGNTGLLIRSMRDLGVTGFVGAPSFLLQVINRAQEQGFDFKKDFCLKKALLGAEPLPPSLRRELEKTHGLDTCQGYGSSEVGVTAWECSCKQGLHFSPYFVVEIVDLSTGARLGPGQEGQVVVTCLDPDRPLLRFATGDISSWIEAPCACGDRSPRLGRITGRVGQAFKVRSRFIHLAQVEAFGAGFEEMAGFQVVIDRVNHRDRLTLRVVMAGSRGREPELNQALARGFKEELGLKPDRVEVLDQAQNLGPRVVDKRKWD